MSTVLILGAGVSRATGQSRARSKRPPLDADFFEIARMGKHDTYEEVVDCLENLVGDYSESLMGSLETSATYLYLKAIDSPSSSTYHKGFISLLKLLASVLAETTNDLKLRRRSLIYRFLLSELNRLEQPSDLTVITFNYDLLAENALQEIALNGRPEVLAFPGCYRLDDNASSTGITGQPSFAATGSPYEGVSILKLHGSMNWQSRHTSELPRPSALFHPNRELHIINSRQVSSSLIWRRKHRMVYMKPIIVPPTSGKRGMMHRSMTGLWDIAAEKLAVADRIVIAGYSCPPLDLEARILLSENLRLNESKKVYVIDPNAHSAAKFVDMCGVTHSTIYTSLSSWVDDAAL